ncbi:MAG: glutathionylspermidine synthase family protein [Candidatus Hydrogenedentes bacterium]|nr:glutathionylspermidine synthase family protein [Candidatus Hydrogenedentota bacterium]
MRRVQIAPRPDWEKKVEDLGFLYHSVDGAYWTETAYYSFSGAEVDTLERATNELQRLCLDAAEHIVQNDRFAELSIPDKAVPFIKRAWEEEPPAIYGRFDLAFDGDSPPKLLEYNADTPTALLEAAVIQWHWLQDVRPQADQFNSIHERLIAKWQELKEYVTGPVTHFAHADTLEDAMTTNYLRDTADQAGLATKPLLITDIGWDNGSRQFVDLDGQPIATLFKLYPWEWLVHEEFADRLFESYDKTQWIEPIWKMLWSNKGVLAILWELNPRHPNLLEAHIGSPGQMTEYVKKPLLGREGANVMLLTKEWSLATPGDYGEEGFVFQAAAPVPNMDGAYPVIGSWVIDGESSGIGVRESADPITTNTSAFAPHMME